MYGAEDVRVAYGTTIFFQRVSRRLKRSSEAGDAAGVGP